MITSNPAPSKQPQQPVASDAYTDFVKGAARFEHLRTDTPTTLASGLTAHPIYAIKDPAFTDAIFARIQNIVGERIPTAELLFDARREAVRQYVTEKIIDTDPSTLTTFSDKALALIARCFPKEKEAPISWGETYFNTMTGAALIPAKDANGSLKPSYEILNSYVYSKNGEPVAVGGFYVEQLPTGEHGMWGARIAIDPGLQRGATFGKLLAHLAVRASACFESSRIHAMEGKTPLAPSLSVFTTRADWNQRVISIYEGLGFQDLGSNYDIEYNGLTEMIMHLPDLTTESVQEKMRAFVSRFG